MNDRVMEEMSKEMEEKERRNHYKYKLISEYRDVIEKRVRLEIQIQKMNNTPLNETDSKHLELLKKQMETLFQYEDILNSRLRLIVAN